MKRILLALALALAMTSPALAGQQKTQVFTATAVASTGSATSKPVELVKADGSFSIGAVATGSGASVIVAWEASADGVSWDTTTTSPSRTIISDLGTSYLVAGFDLPAARWVRFKATGQGANPANATITAIFTFTTEE